jgi:hypothetical protein
MEASSPMRILNPAGIGLNNGDEIVRLELGVDSVRRIVRRYRQFSNARLIPVF